MDDFIVRGTTPTIKFCYSTIDVNDITVAYLTIKQLKNTVIERDISTAFKDEHHIYWTLSQEETLLLSTKSSADVKCDWKTTLGLRGESHKRSFMVVNPGKDQVI